MAKLLVEEPDALMRARPDLWEPWRVTARATRPAAAERWTVRAEVIITSARNGTLRARFGGALLRS